MLTVEIKINGQLIHYIEALNKGGWTDPSGSTIYEYQVKHVDIAESKVTERQVSHDRSHGALVLAQHMLNNRTKDCKKAKKK